MTQDTLRASLLLLLTGTLISLGCEVTVDDPDPTVAPDAASQPQQVDGSVESDAGIEPEADAALTPQVPNLGVHEWGLVRFISTVADLSTSGHGYYVEDMTADKPLIYFHPGPDFDASTDLTVKIAVEGGRMREMWPDGGELGAESASYTWPSFKIQPNTPCGVEDVPTLWDEEDADGIRAPVSGFCAQIYDGGVCETAEMHAYLGEVPHCLAINDINAPVLLYNAYTNPEQVAPVVFDGDARTVTNLSASPVGPLWATVMSAADRRVVYRVDALAAGETVTIDGLPVMFTDDDHEALISDINASLQAMGLAENEAEDFVNAWRPNVLAPPRDVSSLTRPWAVFGFYTQPEIDQMYPLEVSPAPDHIVRVMGFTLEH